MTDEENKKEKYCPTDVNNIKLRIRSPHTKEALKIIGINQSHLNTLSFNQYLEKNPSIRQLDLSLQKSRYEHSQEKRKMRIQLVLAQRNELKKEDNQSLLKSQSVKKLFITSSTTSTFKSCMSILEKSRLKQEKDLQNVMEYEINNEESRQKTHLKLQYHKEKEEQILRQKQMRLEQEAKIRELKEREREEKRKEEDIAKSRLIKERELKEKQKKKEDEMKHNEEEKRRRTIQKYKEKKSLEIQKKISDKQQQDKHHLIQLQYNLDEKDQIKRKAYHQKQQEEMSQLINKRIKLQKKIDKALQYNELKITKKIEAYEINQKQLQELSIQANKEKEIEAMIHQMEIKKKEAKAKLVLKKNIENEQNRINSITKKIEALSLMQKQKEDYAKIELFQNRTFRQKKGNKFLESKLLKDQEKSEKISSLMKKLELSQDKREKTKLINSYQTQLKINLRALSREDRYENIQIIKNKKEYEREKKFEAITERMKRVEEMQNEKRFMVEEKMKIQDSIRIKKNKMMAKFTKLLHKDRFLSKEEFHKELYGNIDNILLSSKNGSKETLNVNSEDDKVNDSLREESIKNKSINNDNVVKDLTSEKNEDGEEKNKKKEKLLDIVEGEQEKMQNTDFISIPIPVPIDNNKKEGEGDEGSKERDINENKEKKKEEDEKENIDQSEKVDVEKRSEKDIKDPNENILIKDIAKKELDKIENDHENELENAIPNTAVVHKESKEKELDK